MNPEIVVSGDGSHTLKVASLKEHYHSHKGAIQESRYVFLKMGLKEFFDVSEIRVLEVGFGTGLNALLTALEDSGPAVHYTTLETYPLSFELVSQLNYPRLIEGDRVDDLFQQIHESSWGQLNQITESFFIEKRHIGLEAFESHEAFDLVYYDAFAPHAQPELWAPAIWQKLFGLLKPGGMLVTYCAKGQVRRDMQAAGFTVERLPGPPGKREMLRATKP